MYVCRCVTVTRWKELGANITFLGKLAKLANSLCEFRLLNNSSSRVLDASSNNESSGIDSNNNNSSSSSSSSSSKTPSPPPFIITPIVVGDPNDPDGLAELEDRMGIKCPIGGSPLCRCVCVYVHVCI